MSDIDLDGLPSTDEVDAPQQDNLSEDTPQCAPPFPAISYGAFAAAEDNKDRSVENNVRVYNAITEAHMSVREMALNKVAAALSLVNPAEAAYSAEVASTLTNLAGTAMAIAGQNEKSALQLAAANKRLLEKSDSARISSIVAAALLTLNRNTSDMSSSGGDMSNEDLLAQIAETVNVPAGMMVASSEEGIPDEYAPK